MAGMATITEVGGEQPDAPTRAAWLEMVTVTKVTGESTDSW
jgi:hypothetical protein